jgi:hypothetical protein
LSSFIEGESEAETMAVQHKGITAAATGLKKGESPERVAFAPIVSRPSVTYCRRSTWLRGGSCVKLMTRY